MEYLGISSGIHVSYIEMDSFSSGMYGMYGRYVYISGYDVWLILISFDNSYGDASPFHKMKHT